MTEDEWVKCFFNDGYLTGLLAASSWYLWGYGRALGWSAAQSPSDSRFSYLTPEQIKEFNIYWKMGFQDAEGDKE